MANVLGRNPIFIDTGSSVPQINRGMYIRSIDVFNSAAAAKTLTIYNAAGSKIAYCAVLGSNSAGIAGAGRTEGIWLKKTGGTVSSTLTITVFEE